MISSRPLVELVPVQPAAMAGRQLCQWDKDSCADAGFLKIDLLGLGMLSAVERWVLAGRPGIHDVRVTVRYGPVRPHAWWSVRRGDQWVALDWRRPG